VPHQQIRSRPIASPADVERFFATLAACVEDPCPDPCDDPEKCPINVCAVGGGFLEQGGEIAVAVGTLKMNEAEEKKTVEAALHRLQLANYDPRVVGEEDGLRHGFIEDTPGALFEFIRQIATQNLEEGRTIADIAIGAYNEADNTTLVQVYCPEVKTQASREQWQADLPGILGLEIPAGD
jgi:hypothetical protein